MASAPNLGSAATIKLDTDITVDNVLNTGVSVTIGTESTEPKVHDRVTEFQQTFTFMFTD